MNKELKTNSIICLLIFVFILNTGMIERNLSATKSEIQTNTQSMPKRQSKEKIKLNRKRKKLKQSFETQIVDEGALLIAILAIGIGIVAVYFFFTMGFFIGVIALMLVAFLLYSLFRYLEY